MRSTRGPGTGTVRGAVDELYEYRTILEVGGLRAGMAHHKPLTPIEDATAALAALSADTPWPEVLDIHQEIHRTIVRARRACLDRMLITNERHLRLVLGEYVDH